MPSQPAISKKYSLTWARQVVEQLRASRTRATDHVLQLYGITIENLALYLARGDPVYNYLKKRIKYVGNAVLRDDMPLSTIQKLSPERNYIAKFAPESARRRLDSRFLECETRRAGCEGLVSDQSGAAGGDLPSRFFQFFLFPEEMGANGEILQVGSL